jgi:hypothetical protein
MFLEKRSRAQLEALCSLKLTNQSLASRDIVEYKTRTGTGLYWAAELGCRGLLPEVEKEKV